MKLSLAPLWNALYPPVCAACSRRGAWLCPACLAACELVGPGACPRCGDLAGARDCRTCRLFIRSLSALSAAYAYSGPVRPLVHRFKYGEMSGAAPWMAELMLPGLPPGAELLAPVPLHPGREKERGYNQSALLAREVAARAGLPVARGLRRSRPTPSQARLSGEERRSNIRGAFSADGGAFAGRHVVLVDDVCTTCSTLEECASVLRSAGAARVSALVFARA